MGAAGNLGTAGNVVDMSGQHPNSVNQMYPDQLQQHQQQQHQNPDQSPLISLTGSTEYELEGKVVTSQQLVEDEAPVTAVAPILSSLLATSNHSNMIGAGRGVQQSQSQTKIDWHYWKSYLEAT